VRPVLLLLPFLLAACDPAAMTELNQALGIEPETPPGPPPLPPTVAAVLPPGANPALVFQDNAGCYLFSVEVTDPPSGFPLFDAAGNPICEGQAATIAVPVGPAT
jgi:hypothetical protein